jgi:DNA-binding transcriptional LysR family regulator
MSFRYYESLGRPVKSLKRRYLDEINSVIDGVAMGCGVSILPEHLIKQYPRIKVVSPRKRFTSPVYLCYRTRPYYSRTFKEVLELIKKEFPKKISA